MTRTKIGGNKSLIWLTLGVAFFLFSNGRWMAPAAAWIAPVFLLRFLQLRKSQRRLWLLFAIQTVLAGIMLYGIIPPMLGVLFYLLVIYYAIIWFFPYLVDWLLVDDCRRFSSTLWFPVAGVSAEYINTVLFGSWGAIAYSQFGNLPLLQIASITGMWGVSFIVLWFGSVINWAWRQQFDWTAIRQGILVFAGILGMTLIYGGLRIALPTAQSPTVRIASFTASAQIADYYQAVKEQGFRSDIKMAEEDRQALEQILVPVHSSVFAESAVLADSGASLILWPEGMIKVLSEQEESFLNQAAKVARAKNIYMLLAYFVLPEVKPSQWGENKAALINPQGAIEWHYWKTYPVPGATDKPGDGKIPISDTPFGRIGSVICYDMDFTGLIHQAGRAAIDIMLVPAWDWRAIDPLHAQMAVVRAIENGFSMVRQTGDGLSIAVDSRGKTLAAMDHFATEDRVMISNIPATGSTTLYSFIGDLFAWLCVILLIVRFSWGLWRKISK